MLHYRREIDGLRAIAVMPIILFHAGFVGFSGGYLGVDIFFVISGYLITSILWKAHTEQNFSLAGFYERRARRILPALVLVLLCCLPFAWAWMLPAQLEDFSKSLMGVALFVSNFVFLHQSGYFDSAAEFKPLLHTWSLGVEEQFYVVFPLLLMFLLRFGKSFAIAITAAIALASFAFSTWASHHLPAENFYLISSRAWELLAGALVAFKLAKSGITQASWHRWASAAGLAAILISLFTYTVQTPIPGPWALLPVMGTALIILYAGPHNWTGRLLALKPFVGIGLISYSAYLWHQPVFVFARIFNIPPARHDIFAALVVLSLGLAYLSWRFVELPARKNRKISRRTVFGAATVALLFLCAFGAAGVYSHGFPNRYGDYQARILTTAQYENHRLYRKGKCQLDLGQHFSDYRPECFADPASTNKKIVLWGDSIMTGMWVGLKKEYPDYSVEQLTYGGCPPLIHYQFHPDRPFCAETYAKVIDHIASDKKVTRIFLLGHWQYYVLDHPDLPQTLAATVRMLQEKRPDLEIIVMGPVPKWADLPKSLAFEWGQFTGDLRKPTPDYISFKKLDDDLRTALFPTHARFISILDIACPDNQCLVANFNHNQTNFWTFDTGHLTEWGSDYLAKSVKAILDGPPNSE